MTKAKKQIVFIHGGEPFLSYESYIKYLKTNEVSLEDFLYGKDKKWRDVLAEKTSKRFDFLMPRMPNSQMAKYYEWKIWFQRVVPFIKDDPIFIGYSLGAIFLVKFLSENKFNKKISKLILVGAPHHKTIGLGDFILKKPIKEIENMCKEIHFFHSEDDNIVPISELSFYQKDWPKAKIHIFKNRGHFFDQNFPEIVKLTLDNQRL
jgi:predicted alpha/beta hydrolase family esterase